MYKPRFKYIIMIVTWTYKKLINLTGTLIDAIGTEHFQQTLSDALKSIPPLDYT